MAAGIPADNRPKTNTGLEWKSHESVPCLAPWFGTDATENRGNVERAACRPPRGLAGDPFKLPLTGRSRRFWRSYFFLTTFFFGQVTTGFLPFRFTTVQAFGVALATVMPTDTDRITLSAVKPDTCTV